MLVLILRNTHQQISQATLPETPSQLPCNVQIEQILRKTNNAQISIDCEKNVSNHLGQLKNFKMLSIVGRGAFAKVILVRNKNDDRVYVLKVLKKKQEDVVLNTRIQIEREILQIVDHEFIVKMLAFFNNEKRVYFCLEFCPGGELYRWLQINKRFNEEQYFIYVNKRVKFYSAQMILALEYLHSKDIVYRDLKPENVLIAKDGYIKLTDFGLSSMHSQASQLNANVCGTPEYMAPEVLSKKPHGKMVDWWTLGVIIYEMAIGEPPFLNTVGQSDLFYKIQHRQPGGFHLMGNSMRNLVEALLEKVPEQRLGFKGGAKDIKSHEFFSRFDWDKLTKKGLKAPYIPSLKDDQDTSNFDTNFTTESVNSTPVRSLNNTESKSNEINAMMSQNEKQIIQTTSTIQSLSPEIIDGLNTYVNKDPHSKMMHRVESTELIFEKQTKF